MGDCCNSRTLSYVSAGIQIALWVIISVFAFLVIAALTNDSYPATEEANILAAFGIIGSIIILILALFEVIFLIILIVGVKKNHLTMVSIYVYPTLVILVLEALYIVYVFIMGFVRSVAVSTIFISLFVNLLFVGIHVLMFAPMYMFHKRLRKPHFQPEHHDLRHNQPINKPQYVA